MERVELETASTNISRYAKAAYLEVGHTWELPGYRSIRQAYDLEQMVSFL